MVRFYSPEWVAAFNDAVAGLDTGSVDVGGSLTASDGRFRVAQIVRGAPGGGVVVTLVVEDGRLSLGIDGPGDDAPGDDAPGDDAPGGPASGQGDPDDRRGPDVTISLSYEDAIAMSRGDLDPADAVGRGRVRVRGDLAVLVAGQALLAAAGGRLTELQAATTY